MKRTDGIRCHGQLRKSAQHYPSNSGRLETAWTKIVDKLAIRRWFSDRNDSPLEARAEDG
jgi:hypothetical protein